MATPESKVKKAVRARLEAHGVLPFLAVADAQDDNAANGMYWMPVQSAYAIQGVHDFAGCWHGVFFTIETKAPDNPVDATEPQKAFALAVQRSGGIAMVGVRDARAVDALYEMIYARMTKE